MTHLSFSRRAVCTGVAATAGLAMLPFGTLARDDFKIGDATTARIPRGSVWDLRGVRPQGHAILRTTGVVASEVPGDHRTWTFVENTQVSWLLAGDGVVVEQRCGRIQLTPTQIGKTIEVVTGPVEESLPLVDPNAATASSALGDSLIVAAATLAPSDVWHIADDPASALLPQGLSEFRVYRARRDEANDGVRHVTWALRSPWLAVLGAGAPDARLMWRGQGQLASWRQFDDGQSA